ncbi:gluconokinase [Rhizobium leguminosarum]|uniref:gluconokinase n=1 Tax=Rhizobium leguminosarum TaxID=384 RepID=UPI00143F6016|nr:gluconokinase [Rhizobium leguminosarum]NKK63981.1 AAA family ATPase [Rhizobium leguminosarum bv. viciae]NKL07416.1 AAA family ATPase [Rhizobium leguminosarum bv. viciae]NKL82598.1 AAA family ATPase [Rhizobium leguminosarum bv. viciae]NKL93345.1 AAA family ATPase [Rhizobium leguminosarum bv. viciae]NKM90797.1 AAA family ATPase [Rhizobium leguminosarum bv. viciae]
MPDERTNKAHAIFVMGVSGCGKSSIGEKLAEALHLAFIEGDALHPAANVEKMSKGIPLTDEDRMPWLDRIGEDIKASLEKREGIIVSCSALKRLYRDRLRAAAGGNLFFVYLEGSRALLMKRMGERKGHFMPVSLLDSQLATLEVPTGEQGVVTVDIDDTVEGIAAKALKDLAALGITG